MPKYIFDLKEPAAIQSGRIDDHFFVWAVQLTDGLAVPGVTLVTLIENPTDVIEWA